MTMKLVKTAAALALGASLVTSAVVPTDASAASKYKVSKGKLVVAKTGKVATGTYKGVYYVKGVKLTGLKGKVYYKAGKKASGTYKGAYYYKGAKKVTTGTYNNAYYVKGVKKVTTGLYGSTYYKSGKKATGTYKSAYYVNGAKKVTTGLYNKAYYVAGKKVVSTGIYKGAYYVAGKKVVSTGTYKGAYYVAGKKVVTNGLYAEKLYTAGALNKGFKLYDEKLYKDAILNKGLVSFEEKVYNDAELAEGTFEFEGKEEAFEAGIKVGAKVASVEAINATQVKVTFNKTVDKDTVNTVATGAIIAANVKFTAVNGATAVTASSAVVEGKTVTYTLSGQVAGEHTVEIDNLKTTAKEDIARYSKVVKFAADTVAPTILGTENTSATQVKVNFSEPVKNGTISATYADGTAITGLTTPSITTGGTSVVFDLSNAGVVVGKEIVVTLNGVQDLAGNLINPQPATVTIKKGVADAVAPTLTAVTQTGAKTFTVKFDKAVNETALTSATTNVVLSPTNAVTAIEKVTDTEYKVTVTNPLDGLVTVSLIPAAVKNLDGTSPAADLTKLVTFNKDVVAPKATSKVVTVDGLEFLELTFDKNVELKGAKELVLGGTYTKEYIESTVAPVTAVAKYADATGIDKKVVLVPLAGLTVVGAEYNVTVANTTATNGITNEADTELETFTTKFVRGTDAPVTPVVPNAVVYTSFTAVQGSSNDEVVVTFTVPNGEKLDGATATTASNYVIAGATVESAKLSAVSGTEQVVTLKIAKNSSTFNGTRNVTVNNVKIAGSTEVKPSTTTISGSLHENVRAQLTKTEITSANTVKLTFNETISTVDADAFLVKVGGVAHTGTVVAAVTSPTTNSVTITLGTALSTADLAKSITVEAAKDATGKVDVTKFLVNDANSNLVEDFGVKTAALAN